MSDEIYHARAALTAASPGPWSYREYDGMAAVACANGWALEDGNPNPELPDKKLVVLAVNALGPLLDAIEAADKLREIIKGGPSYREQVEWCEAYDDARAAFDQAVAKVQESTR